MHLLHSINSTPRYVLSAVLASSGGFLFGMDTSVIGPVTVMENYVSLFGTHSAIIHGAIVSSILIPAAMSALLAGYVADLLGRPRCIAIGAFIFGSGAAIEAGAVSLAMFIVGRVLSGLGEGLFLGTLVVYICEITPPSRRGPFTTGPQLAVCFGILTGYFTCYGTANIDSSLSWRVPFILLSSLSFVFCGVSHLWLVPSPRWMALRGRHAEAAATWDKLQVKEADRDHAEVRNAEKDARSSPNKSESTTNSEDQAELNEPSGRSKNRKTQSQFFDIFSRDVRARTLLAIFVMSMQQLSGIDAMLYYSPLIFQQAGIGNSQATFLASSISAVVIVVVSIPATIYADSWGRRSSMIWGGFSMGVAMFLIGALYAANVVNDTNGARWFVVVTIYIYMVLYCISWAVSAKVYAAEVQPQRTRASATNISQGANWVTNFAMALTTPVLLDRTSYGAYFLWGGCLFLTAVVCTLFMAETRGKSLDDIEAAFNKGKSGLQVWRSTNRVAI